MIGHDFGSRSIFAGVAQAKQEMGCDLEALWSIMEHTDLSSSLVTASRRRRARGSLSSEGVGDSQMSL